MKATAEAPTNVAIIKYWGKQPGEERLPTNSSLSLTVDTMHVTTEVAFSPDLMSDSFTLYGQPAPADETSKLSGHLDRLRALAGVTWRAQVASDGNIPPACGLSSSAAGFAALTVAAATALNLHVDETGLSILARQGSGSACRSIPAAGGLVLWQKGSGSETSIAESVAPPTWSELCVVALILSRDKKYQPTTMGMAGAQTSPFFAERLQRIDQKIAAARQAYAEQDFTAFGQLAEQEARELHAIMMTQAEPSLYLNPATLAVMQTIQRDWRPSGLEVYYTLNTGQNPWLLVQEKDLPRLQQKLAGQEYIINHLGTGARTLKVAMQSLAAGTVHALPSDMRQAILADKKMVELWEDITPLARNEWICWTISVAKPETRTKHIRVMRDKMLRGTRRPCCWAGCIHRPKNGK